MIMTSGFCLDTHTSEEVLSIYDQEIEEIGGKERFFKLASLIHSIRLKYQFQQKS